MVRFHAGTATLHPINFVPSAPQTPGDLAKARDLLDITMRLESQLSSALTVQSNREVHENSDVDETLRVLVYPDERELPRLKTTAERLSTIARSDAAFFTRIRRILLATCTYLDNIVSVRRSPFELIFIERERTNEGGRLISTDVVVSYRHRHIISRSLAFFLGMYIGPVLRPAIPEFLDWGQAMNRHLWHFPNQLGFGVRAGLELFINPEMGETVFDPPDFLKLSLDVQKDGFRPGTTIAGVKLVGNPD